MSDPADNSAARTLALAVDRRRGREMPATAWRYPYGWLLILADKKELGGARRYRDLGPEVTLEGARRIQAEEMAMNDRIHWSILRQKDFDPMVDRWYSRSQRPERDHDLVPERVRLDAELEDD